MFLMLMIVGLTGLLLLAVPAFQRHGHVGVTTHSAGSVGHATHGAGQIGTGHATHGITAKGAAHEGGAHNEASNGAPAGITRFLPSPRLIFSLLALYGAFGNALLKAGHLPALWAGLLATVPALLLERYLVTPLWNALFRLQADPCSPLEYLVLSEAKAVTPFRNGRGLVSVVRDGRLVQFAAQLDPEHAALPVHVGDSLRIEDIDAACERVTVSLAVGKE